MNGATRYNACHRAEALARLEKRDYTVWLAGPERFVVTSSRNGDEKLDGFYARVSPSGRWSGPAAKRVRETLKGPAPKPEALAP